MKTMFKHGNDRIMVWRTFSSSGVGELIRCDEHLNAKEDLNILEKGLLPTINKLFSSVN